MNRSRAGHDATARSRTWREGSRRGFTLVEVLIALALGTMALLPALAAFNATLKASARQVEACQLHLAAATALETRAAVLRRGEAASGLDVQQSAFRVVVRVRQGEDPAAQTVEVAADGAGTVSRSFVRTLFPPIRRNRKPEAPEDS